MNNHNYLAESVTLKMNNRLKNIIASLALLVTAFVFFGCGSDETEKNVEADNQSVSSSLTLAPDASTTTSTTAITTSTTTTATTTTTTATTTATTTTTTVTVISTATTSSTTTTTVTAVDEAPFEGLYDAENLGAIYEKSTDERIYPASLTKLLTACTALEYVSPDTVFNVGTELNLVNSGSSVCMISQGHSLTLYDLMTGMLVRSGNDAAYTIAVNVARKVSGDDSLGDSQAVEFFVSLMNDYAQSIGMEHSSFINPDGWDDENQYTTVSDLAIIAAKALEIEQIREIVSLPSKYVVFASGQNITWNNTNALINPESQYYCEDAIGMKTGSTLLAGKCLIAAFDVDGKIYIAITANSQSEEQRYESTLKLYDMLFE